MKPTISIFLFILIVISSCTSQAKRDLKSFTLQGELIGQDTGKIIISYVPSSSRLKDTAVIKDGKFVFKGEIPEPIEAEINGGNDLNTAVFYLEPTVMKLVLTKNNFKDFKLTGSKTQDERNELIEMEKPIYERIKPLREQSFRISDSIENSKSITKRKEFERQAKATDEQWSKAREELDLTWLKFIREHPKSYVTPSYLRMIEGNEVISLDSLKLIFNRLDITIQNSKIGNVIKEHIRKKENIQIGMLAPDFKAIDINQQTITLNQFKNKNVVLLDFWASWCVPCREDIPFLKDRYKKYHSKGLEIVAVSVDLERNAWLSAIKQDSTEIWFHIPVAEKYALGPDYLTNDDINKNYFVQLIPAKILIDKDGKIVGRWVGGSKDNTDSLENKLDSLLR